MNYMRTVTRAMVYTCTDDSRDFEERLELLLFPFLDFSGLSMGLQEK